SLVENAIYGWEGDKLNFYLKASTTQGQIAKYELDVNNDGTYDYETTDIYGDGEALAFDLSLMQLLGSPADDGDYLAKVKVTTTTGATAVFPVDISVGNVPPDIEFDEDAV